MQFLNIYAFETECWLALTTIAIYRFSFTFLHGIIFLPFFFISIYNIPYISFPFSRPIIY